MSQAQPNSDRLESDRLNSDQLNSASNSPESSSGRVAPNVTAVEFSLATTETPAAVQLTDPSSDPNQPEPTHGLPSPRDYPQADVVIYDGRCIFCQGQVKNLQWLDGKNRLAFISLHDAWVAENFPDLSYDDLMEQIYLIPATEHGYSSVRLGGAAVIRYLSRRLPKLWIAAPLLHLPFTLPLWQWGYHQVAKRRYRIAGKQGPQCDENGTCELHFGDKKK